MDLVIDSNILFAALLKESGTSDILFKHKLYAPEFIFVGLGNKSRKRIVTKLNISRGKVRVMDAGCGSGSLAIDVKKESKNISLYAVDADYNILKIAEKKAKREGQQINFREAYLQKLPFPDNSFDVVYSSLVFHHFNGDAKKSNAGRPPKVDEPFLEYFSRKK